MRYIGLCAVAYSSLNPSALRPLLSGNQDHFDHLTGVARAWKNQHGTCSPKTLDLLRAHLAETATAAGMSAWETRDLSLRIGEYWSKAGHGLVPTPKGLRRGRGCKPAPERRRPYGTSRMKRQTREFVVPYLIDRHNTALERLRTDPTFEKHPDMPVGKAKGGRLSVSQIHSMALARGSAMSRSAIQTAVAKVSGTPRRDDRIAALSRPARDLVKVIADELPKGRLSLVVLDSVIYKLWTGCARKGLHRLRKLIREIEAARIGLHFMITDDGLVVGQGRKIPYILPDMLACNELKLRRLSPGQLPSRQKLWGTEEGQLALEVVDHVESDGDVIGNHGMAIVADSHVWTDYDDLCRHADYLARLATQDGLCRRQKADMAEKAFWAKRRIRSEVDAGIRARTCINEAAKEGLGAAWRAACGLPVLSQRAIKDPVAGRRMERIAKLLDRCRDMKDVESLMAWMAKPRAIRGAWTAPSNGRPVKYPSPRPLPKFKGAERLAMYRRRREIRAAVLAEYAGIPDFLRPAHAREGV